MATNSALKKTLTREAITLGAALLFGFLALPPIIYWVGQTIFGDYGGGDLGDFYSNLKNQIRAGNAIACFLVLSPYLIWQTLRGTIHLFRFAARQP